MLHFVLIKFVGFFTLFTGVQLTIWALALSTTYSMFLHYPPESGEELQGPGTWRMQVELFNRGILPFVIVALCLLAGAYVVAGLGVWRLHNWGRRLATILWAVWLAFSSGLALLTNDWQTERVALYFELLLGAVFCMLIVWYLFRPDVKRAFGAT